MVYRTESSIVSATVISRRRQLFYDDDDSRSIPILSHFNGIRTPSYAVDSLVPLLLGPWIFIVQ